LGAILGAIRGTEWGGPTERVPHGQHTESFARGRVDLPERLTRPGSGVTVERWIASVDLGVGPNGKRRRKRITGPTRKAVADNLRQLQREQDAGIDVRK
jgi:hypothetical protein